MVKRFDDAVAVDGISLEIQSGWFFALLGPSGCGKTTTLRMIGGFEQPDEGAILLGGRDVVGLPPYKRDVNTVFQSYALFPHLTVSRTSRLGSRRKGVDSARAEAAGSTRRWSSSTLDGLGHAKPRQLSGGQQQRVALARALVNRPQVLLLDEPLGALDLKLRKQMQLELKRIQHEVGITFVHVTHDQEEAMTMADKIAVMNERPDRAARLARRSSTSGRATAFVAGFLGVSNLLFGTVAAPDRVRLDAGDEMRVAARRPHRPRRGRHPSREAPPRPPREGENTLSGTVTETAYVGVATQYVVATAAGDLIVYAQNTDGEPPARRGATALLSWTPESTFVVDPHPRRHA